MIEDKQNGWNEYSRLVLAELEKLNKNVGELSRDIDHLKEEMTKIKGLKYGVDDLKEWRKDISEVASPTQLKELTNEVQSLKTFKTVATTVWAVVQIGFGIFIAYFKK
jgi:prefoldin subunit 5